MVRPVTAIPNKAWPIPDIRILRLPVSRDCPEIVGGPAFRQAIVCLRSDLVGLNAIEPRYVWVYKSWLHRATIRMIDRLDSLATTNHSAGAATRRLGGFSATRRQQTGDTGSRPHPGILRMTPDYFRLSV